MLKVKRYSQLVKKGFILFYLKLALLESVFWNGRCLFSYYTQTFKNRRLQKKLWQTYSCMIPPYASFPFCIWEITVVQVSYQKNNAERQACKRTAKHLCSAQRSCLSYNCLPCPTSGFSYKQPCSSTQNPFISMRSKEDDGRCFPIWAEKWLPFSKGRGCTWLADSCVSCEITRHLEGLNRKKRQENRDEEKMKWEKPLRCHAREGIRGSLRFQMSVLWNCGFKHFQSRCHPISTPFIPDLSSAHHEMWRLVFCTEMTGVNSFLPQAFEKTIACVLCFIAYGAKRWQNAWFYIT